MPEYCLRHVDLETVGFLDEQPEAIQKDPARGVLEIGFADVLVNVQGDKIVGVEVDARYGALLYCPPDGIPAASRAVHHIGPKDVAGLPACDAKAVNLLMESPSWRGDLKPFALVAHHACGMEMDWLNPYLPKDARWIDSLKVARQLFPDWKSHSNHACRYELGLELDPAIAEPPHRAGPDAWVTANLTAAFLKHTSVRQMILWTQQPTLLTTCPLGDWRGKPWAEVDAGFLRWMLGKGSALRNDDAVHWAKIELERRATIAADPAMSGDYG